MITLGLVTSELHTLQSTCPSTGCFPETKPPTRSSSTGNSVIFWTSCTTSHGMPRQQASHSGRMPRTTIALVRLVWEAMVTRRSGLPTQTARLVSQGSHLMVIAPRLKLLSSSSTTSIHSLANASSPTAPIGSTPTHSWAHSVTMVSPLHAYPRRPRHVSSRAPQARSRMRNARTACARTNADPTKLSITRTADATAFSRLAATRQAVTTTLTERECSEIEAFLLCLSYSMYLLLNALSVSFRLAPRPACNSVL